MTRTRIGIIGYGVFGRFMAAHLAKRAEVVVWSRTKRPVAAGVRWAEFDEVARQPVVVLAVSVQAMEGVLKDLKPLLQPGTLVLDVASVKSVPVELMQRYVPRECEIVATHPLFGPQSGAKGIEGLTMVLWPVRVKRERYEAVWRFAAGLGLKVVEVAPEEHDREMAYVQALTFMIGEALGKMELPDTGLKTATYQHLLDIRRIAASNTSELFGTIQRYNPYAAEVRERFLRELSEIHQNE